MRTLSVELDEETVRSLEAERRRAGFESRSAYLRWIVERRGSLDAAETDRDVREADAGERIATLESRLEAIENALDRDEAPASTTTDGSRVGEEPGDGRTVEDEPASGLTVGDEPASGSTVEGEPSDVTAKDDGDTSSEPATRATAKADGGWTRAEQGGSDSTRTGSSPTDPATAGISSMNLTPERVERIRDESLARDAGVLGSVGDERLDELSRRAVASTRERLDREVETGLTYRSTTGLADDAGTVRPGEDVTDLHTLSVPGRSEEIIERRRELAGRAVAFLRDHGPARKSDLVEALHEEHPAGYDSVGGWWRCLKGALKQVDAVSGGDGTRIWRYDG